MDRTKIDVWMNQLTAKEDDLRAYLEEVKEAQVFAAECRKQIEYLRGQIAKEIGIELPPPQKTSRFDVPFSELLLKGASQAPLDSPVTIDRTGNVHGPGFCVPDTRIDGKKS